VDLQCEVGTEFLALLRYISRFRGLKVYHYSFPVLLLTDFILNIINILIYSFADPKCHLFFKYQYFQSIILQSLCYFVQLITNLWVPIIFFGSYSNDFLVSSDAITQRNI
jgi:hypothetical protein